MTAPTRRERLRTATVSEIKDGARRLLVTGGPQAISLRAIARDMGMTAPAIYRYFPSLDALVAALASDLYDELRQHIEAARDAAGDDPIRQLGAMARAFRNWSIRHPAEFTLAFGSGVPGVKIGKDDCVHKDHSGPLFSAVFMKPLLELWRRKPFPTPPAEILEQRLGASLAPLRHGYRDIPIQVAYVYLSGWTTLYGLVAMEITDNLRWAVTDPEALFETELAVILHRLTEQPTTGHADPH